MSEIQLLLYKYFLGSLTWVSCGQVRFDAVRCGSVVRSGVVPWCDQMWPDGAVSYGRCGQVWLRGAVSCGQVRSVTVGCGQVCLRGAASEAPWCGQVWFRGAVSYGRVRSGVAPWYVSYGRVRSGAVWCGLVRSGAVWCG